MLWFMYALGVASSLFLAIAFFPELVAHLKAKIIKGASITSYLYVSIGLILSGITNLYFGNWPVAIYGFCGGIFALWLVWLRYSKREK